MGEDLSLLPIHKTSHHSAMVNETGWLQFIKGTKLLDPLGWRNTSYGSQEQESWFWNVAQRKREKASLCILTTLLFIKRCWLQSNSASKIWSSCTWQGNILMLWCNIYWGPAMIIWRLQQYTVLQQYTDFWQYCDLLMTHKQ